MFALNVMCTYLTGYYNRNDRVRKLLEDKNDEFAEKEEVVDILNSASDFINRLDFKEESIWWSKANFFSLMCEVARETRIIAVGVEATRERLLSFASALPEDYALAARGGGAGAPFCLGHWLGLALLHYAVRGGADLAWEGRGLASGEARLGPPRCRPGWGGLFWGILPGKGVGTAARHRAGGGDRHPWPR